jgi:hypothetical protein
VVRELLDALDSLALGLPASFLEWRQAQDEEAARQDERRNSMSVPLQAIVDRVLRDYDADGQRGD